MPDLGSVKGVKGAACLAQANRGWHGCPESRADVSGLLCASCGGAERQTTGNGILNVQIVLYQPEIPPNTGNIARLCAATKVKLNLIEPLGFRLEDRYLKRAGLDYSTMFDLTVWPSLDAWRQRNGDVRLIPASARGGEPAHRFAFKEDDALLFGRETSGLPDSVYASTPYRIRLPFAPGVRREDGGRCVRSLNLSKAAGILLYLALEQCGFLDAWSADLA